jgi:hypothetical protein
MAFINDALSKLASVSGSGHVSFSMHWKVNALVTALQSVQPTQPTTPTDQAAANNTQLVKRPHSVWPIDLVALPRPDAHCQ